MNKVASNILLLTFIVLVLTENTCECMNKGVCMSYNRCQCPPGLIGQKCQIKAHNLQSQLIRSTLNTDQTYFYFQPTQTNYYKLNFKICMLHNPSLLPSLFYIQIQKANGALRSIHSSFQTAKIVLGEKGCVSFQRYYISTKSKEDEIYRKIVVGLRALEKDDPSQYSNVYQSEQTKEKDNALAYNILPSEFIYQTITVQMKYQKQIQNNFYSNFIILSIVSFLLIVLSVFVNQMQKRYRVQIQNRISQFQEFDLSRYRYHSRHSPQQEARQRKIKTQCIEMFMPVTLYGEKNCFLVAESLSNCQQSLQNDSEDCCSICLNIFAKDQQIRTTPCHHKYHKECIDNWCKFNLSCPICRHPLDFTKQIKKIYFHFLRGEIIR